MRIHLFIASYLAVAGRRNREGEGQRPSSKVEELRFIAALAAQMLRGALARRESAHKRSDASAHAAVVLNDKNAVVAHTSADEEQSAAAEAWAPSFASGSGVSRPSRAHSLQGCGGISIPLRGGEAVPSDGLCSVLRNTLAVLKYEAQVELSVYKPLCRCKAVESHSLGIVLRNTFAVMKHDTQVELSA